MVLPLSFAHGCAYAVSGMPGCTHEAKIMEGRVWRAPGR